MGCQRQPPPILVAPRFPAKLGDLDTYLMSRLLPSAVSKTSIHEPERLTLTIVAPQLGNRLQHAVPRQLRRRIREPAKQDLLHLVRLLLPVHRLHILLHLRDQGLDARGDRHHVPGGHRGSPEHQLEAHEHLPRAAEYRAPGRPWCRRQAADGRWERRAVRACGRGEEHRCFWFSVSVKIMGMRLYSFEFLHDLNGAKRYMDGG